MFNPLPGGVKFRVVGVFFLGVKIKMMDAESLYQQGLKLHQKGDLRAAASVYRQVIAQNPKHPSARHFLGVWGWFCVEKRVRHSIESGLGG